MECAGHISEPEVITAHAKLVTCTGVVDGWVTQKCPYQLSHITLTNVINKVNVRQCCTLGEK